MRFLRECKGCQEYFRPTGKFNFYCDTCKEGIKLRMIMKQTGVKRK